jgi:hypothetical protein
MHIHDIGLHMMANAIEFTEFTDHPISLDTILGLILHELLVFCSSLVASDIPWQCSSQFFSGNYCQTFVFCSPLEASDIPWQCSSRFFSGNHRRTSITLTKKLWMHSGDESSTVSLFGMMWSSSNVCTENPRCSASKMISPWEFSSKPCTRLHSHNCSPHP